MERPEKAVKIALFKIKKILRGENAFQVQQMGHNLASMIEKVGIDVIIWKNVFVYKLEQRLLEAEQKRAETDTTTFLTSNSYSEEDLARLERKYKHEKRKNRKVSAYKPKLS